MIKKFRPLLALLAVALFFSCELWEQETIQSSIEGEWASAYNDGFSITKEEGEDWYTFTYYYDQSAIYSGKILHHTGFVASSGFIYFEYETNVYDSTSIGKICAVYWKDLKGDAVREAMAYKSGGLSYTDTLEEATTEFTVDNGYYPEPYLGSYARQ